MSSNSTSAAKERHYAHLSAQLQQLSSNVVEAQHHLNAAANQAKYIRGLGASQAALFMATLHQVDQESGAGGGDTSGAAQPDDKVKA